MKQETTLMVLAIVYVYLIYLFLSSKNAIVMEFSLKNIFLAV